MFDAIALGSGLVGEFVINQLTKLGFQVHVIDLNIPEHVKNNPQVSFQEGDVFDLSSQMPQAKIAVNMLPGRIGEQMRTVLIESGIDIVDLAFTEQDPSQHNSLAKENSVRMIWDVGIAPGLSNMILKKEFVEDENILSATIKVGGNPQSPDDTWSYMAPFSPSDVIEEYTRPARILVDGAVKTVPALTEKHFIEVDGFGKMEAFLTDGLRSLLVSNLSGNMKEYTVRWPGHIAKWVELAGELTEEELLDAWKFDKQRDEFTWMEIAVHYVDKTVMWIISDTGKDGFSSMARSTGLVTIACFLELLNKPNNQSSLSHSGVFSPEDLETEHINRIIDFVKTNGVSIQRIIK
jgi:saccharopine dehydrogenase-like NADP-dependent oxidoreductase